MNEELSALLEKIKEKRGLTHLYLINQVKEEERTKFLFGVRPNGLGEVDREAMKEEILEGLKAKDLIKIENHQYPEFLQTIEIELLCEPYQEVKHLLDSKISSYAAADGGEIKIKEIQEEKGLVVLSMMGACSGCPSAVLTLRAGIRRILEKSLPWFKKVEPAEESKEPNFGFSLK